MFLREHRRTAASACTWTSDQMIPNRRFGSNQTPKWSICPSERSGRKTLFYAPNNRSPVLSPLILAPINCWLCFWPISALHLRGAVASSTWAEYLAVEGVLLHRSRFPFTYTGRIPTKERSASARLVKPDESIETQWFWLFPIYFYHRAGEPILPGAKLQPEVNRRENNFVKMIFNSIEGRGPI